MDETRDGVTYPATGGQPAPESVVEAMRDSGQLPGWKDKTTRPAPSGTPRFEAKVPGGSLTISQDTYKGELAWWIHLIISGGRFEPMTGDGPPFKEAIEDALDRNALVRERLLELLKEAS